MTWTLIIVLSLGAYALKATGKGEAYASALARLLYSRLRSSRSRRALRMRTFLGVTSTSSSSEIHSRAVSRVRVRGTLRTTVWSLLEERWLVTQEYFNTLNECAHFPPLRLWLKKAGSPSGHVPKSAPPKYSSGVRVSMLVI